MKYKVGDKVRIKSIDWYNENKGNADKTNSVWCKDGGAWFFSHMSQCCGKIMTIKNVWTYSYTFEESDSRWTDEMIEGLVEEIPKFKPNDIVDTNDNLYGCITDDIKYDEDKKSFKYYVSFIVDGGYYYESQLKPHKPKDKPDMGEVSDGYHTFNELYEYRLLYNASFFNELAKQNLYDVHKSKKHFDGEECFGGGWFIVMAELPTGQISNHYPMKDWDLFNIPEKEKANKWDGHTPQDVAKRMREFLTPKPKYPKTYEECCENTFGLIHYGMTVDVSMHYSPLIINFTKLLICRDAYWKIAGEEMGLGKPWKPDWNDCTQHKFGLYTLENEIRCINLQVLKNIILVFPTEEMRDAFYVNFKDLIEQCKELL